MPQKQSLSAADQGLRTRAEERLRSQSEGTGAHLTTADTKRLLLELQVHEIELEMQNEELQLARDQMEAETEKFTDLYDFAPVGYLTLDRKGVIQEANLTCTHLLGVERSRLLKRRFVGCISAVDQPAFHDFLNRAFESNVRESHEVSLLREGMIPIEARLEAMAAASGEECRVAVTDITEINQAAADHLVMSKLESTGILASGIAHDFNNLLIVISMNLELAQEQLPAGEKSFRHVDEARKAAVLARGLTQQLITLSKGGMPMRKRTELPDLIQESSRLALSGSNVRGDFILADNLWPVDVDAGQIGQVIRNVVQNAREAMPHGGVVTIRAINSFPNEDEDPAPHRGGQVRITITDQGPGISKEVLSKIFDPYFSTKQRGEQKGMGLGLTICHSVMQKHDGTITVESEPGLGTTFHLDLPAHRMASEPARPVESTIHPQPRRILVMDDEESLRKVFDASLQSMGHEVVLVKDGRMAIDAYTKSLSENQRFDGVILDLTVRAGMGGEETIQALLQLDPKVNAFVVSGHANDPAILEFQRHGFIGALVKPFDFAQLQKAVSRFTRNPPVRRATP